jgi:hypothetical protein
MADLVSHIVGAATTAGWANPSGTQITLPGGMTVDFTTSDDQYVKTLRVEDVNDNTRFIEFRAPYINGTGTGFPDTPTPTKLSLFTGAAPDHFLAGVVEFGANSYRHFYIGHAEKIGNYTSDGMLSCNQFNFGYGTTTIPDFDYRFNSYMFGSRCDSSTIRATSGGMDIQHIDRVDPAWARFGMATGSSVNSHNVMKTNCVVGGSFDGINTVEMYQGQSAFAGQTILTPINLYLTEGDDAAMRLRPLGKPHGVRLVNLENLDTDTSITVGGDTWRVFAEFRRSANTDGEKNPSAPNRYLNAELSHYMGLAYLEG